MLKNTITMKKYNFRKQQICYLYRLTFARIEYHSNNSRILLPPADILLINQSNCFLAVLYNNGRNEEDTSFNDRRPSSAESTQTYDGKYAASVPFDVR